MSLTHHGAREIALSAAVFAVGTIVFISLFRHYQSSWYLVPILPLLLIFAWTLAFFRDPPRVIPQEEGVIVSPADGLVTHLDTADEPDYIQGPALRCSIFLSIFNVHLNRSPAAGAIEFMQHRPGGYYDARSEDSLTKNENQDIGIATTERGMPSKMVVRQSTGAIARRIICPVRPGMELRRGEKYGMIKFGSRTTLLLSPDADIEWKVRVGDTVRAGSTILAVVKTAPTEETK